MKNQPRIKKIFYSLIITFVLIVAYFVMSAFWDVERPFFLILAALGLSFLILGIVLTLLARKEKGRLKLFLMLTGISAIAPFVFSILHNLFYGLAITFENLKFLFEALHVASFLISLLIAPILFVVGVIGSMIYLKNKANGEGKAEKRSSKRI